MPHPDPEIQWLFELTALPTAAGKEQRIIGWIEGWVRERPDLALARDAAGNLVIERRGTGEPIGATGIRDSMGGSPVARENSFTSSPPHLPNSSSPRPLFITAHLDHPAFVVERIMGPGTVQLSFRGGVNDPYFHNARIVLYPGGGDTPLRAVIIGTTKKEPYRECLAEVGGAAGGLGIGDIGRWDLPEPSVEGDILHTHACDDLAAVAAALATIERLRRLPAEQVGHVKLLFTRAEEIGFIGAIAACKLRTMPADSRVIALENSRSFAESPIGAGPIVRVGDRISVFHPGLTAAIGMVAETLATSRPPSWSRDREGAGAPSSAPAPLVSRARKEAGASAGAAFQWQRKLMPGGACEASAFQAYGYEATCICLPLGNYHNMANLDEVQALSTPEAIASGRATSGREFISLHDYKGMIDLLEACAQPESGLDAAEPLIERMEKLYREKSFVLG